MFALSWLTNEGIGECVENMKCRGLLLVLYSLGESKMHLWALWYFANVLAIPYGQEISLETPLSGDFSFHEKKKKTLQKPGLCAR